MCRRKLDLLAGAIQSDQLSKAIAKSISIILMGSVGIDTLTSIGPAHVLVLAMKPISYARHRFPPDVIRHTVSDLP
jgi:hypothetical protein